MEAGVVRRLLKVLRTLVQPGTQDRCQGTGITEERVFREEGERESERERERARETERNTDKSQRKETGGGLRERKEQYQESKQ